MKTIMVFFFTFSLFTVIAQKRTGLNDNGITSKIYFDSTKLHRIDSIIEKGREQIKLPGVSTAIMQSGKIILAKGYGFADRKNKTPASEFTIYPIGSLSKQFTAAAIMKLVERGKLYLDDPVAKYLPEYKNVAKPTLLIRHLLQQTSGIPEWDDLPEMAAVDTSNSDSFTLTKIINVLGHQKQLYPPGYWWSYSNSNYSLLAAVIERISGKTYKEYLNENFFVPLNLHSTSSCEPAKESPSDMEATGYLASEDSFKLRPLSTTKAHAYIGCGGLCSNAIDLTAWMHDLVNGKAVSLASYNQMITPSPVTAGFTPPYGFALSVNPFVNQPAVWHIGVLAGYTSVLLYLPKQDIIIAMLANSRHALLQSVVRNVTRELLHLQAPVIHDLPLNATVIKHSIGNYDDGMFKFSIIEKSDHLFLNVPDLGDPMQLYYQGKNEFITAEPAMIHLRFEPANDVAQRIDWDWGEIRAYGRRIQ